MAKIEEKLMISEPSDSMLLMTALDNFYHEANMLFNNIYLSETIFNQDKKYVFPLSFDYYDASWYKNLLISAAMLIDRFHYKIDPSYDYSILFNNLNDSDFLAFAKMWNKINYIVKFNLDDNAWKVKSDIWKISQTTTWINELLLLNIKFDKNNFNDVSLNSYIYEPFADAIGRNGFDEIINYILGRNNNQDGAKKDYSFNNGDSISSIENVKKQEEREIDPRSPEGVMIEMDKLLEWVLLKQATIRAKNAMERPEQKEVSPVRKVMIELIEWIDKKEILARTYANIKKYGFDPYEYIDIINDLKQVHELRKQLNDKVDQCLEFATNNNPDLRLKPTKQIVRKYYKHIRLKEEELKTATGNDLIKKLEKLNKELKETQKQTKVEIDLINQEINELNALLPPNEKVDLFAEGLSDNIGNTTDNQPIKSASVANVDKNDNVELNINDKIDNEVNQIEDVNDKVEGDMARDNREFKELIADNEINDFLAKTSSTNIDELAQEKVRLIDQELKKINKIITKNKKEIKEHLDIPISKVKDEMDQILIWIGLKCEELKPLFQNYGYYLEGNSPENYVIKNLNEQILVQNEINNKQTINVSKKEKVLPKDASIPVDQKHTIVKAEVYLNEYDYDLRRKQWHKLAGHNNEQVVCSRCHDDDNWETILLDNNQHICYFCWIKKPDNFKKQTKKAPTKKTLLIANNNKKTEKTLKKETKVVEQKTNSLVPNATKKPKAKQLKIEKRSMMNQLEELYFQAIDEKKQQDKTKLKASKVK